MGKLIQSVSIVLIVSLAAAAASPARLEKLRPSKSKFLARQEVAEDVPAQTPYPPAGIKPAIPFNLPTDEKLVAPVNYYLPPLPAAANFNVAPAEVYGPPAETYGPPEVSVKDDAEEVANDEPEQPEPEQPEEEKPEEIPEEEKSEEEKPEVEQPEEELPQEPTPDAAQPEEDDGDVSAEPEESKESSAEPEETPKPADSESEPEPEPEEDVVDLEPVAVEESVSNALLERLVLARANNRRAAKLRSGKLRSAKLQLSPVVPLRRQAALSAQPIYLYSYNGQLFRL